MAKIKAESELEDGWSRWVPPIMSGYRLACCDCNLVHDMEFQVVKVESLLPDGFFEHGEPLDPKKYRILFRARRNNRSTAQMRRHNKKY